MVIFTIVCRHGNSLQYTHVNEKEIPGVLLIFTVNARSFNSKLKQILIFKPWTNGVASRRKLKTWGYLRHLRALALTCVDLRWIALTLVKIKFARKSKQVFHRLATHPSQRKFIDVH